MGSINELQNIGPSAGKLGKNEGARKLKNEEKYAAAQKTSDKNTSTKDVAEISGAGRDLLALKLDAKKYLTDVKNSEPLSEFEIDQIKEKIQNKYFMEAEVIDKIVDELIALPNYFDKTGK